jgi:hypothetical protein
MFGQIVLDVWLSESLIRKRLQLDGLAEAYRVKKKEEEPRCDNCGNLIDDCRCVCPYCGESAGCHCCIGDDKATGG